MVELNESRKFFSEKVVIDCRENCRDVIYWKKELNSLMQIRCSKRTIFNSRYAELRVF